MTRVQTYYDVLGIDTGASNRQIKDAFRYRAKRLHPDTSVQFDSDSEHMRILINAYRTLVDPQRRRRYDREHSIVGGCGGFDYRVFLKERSKDMESQAKLIFYDLLHNRYQNEAIALYDRLFRYNQVPMERYMSREDYMDCAFLLAEEYLERGALLQAYRLFMQIAYMERQRPYFRHFFVEVVDHLRVLICKRMKRTVSVEMRLNCLAEIIEFNISRRDTARYCIKAAELHVKNRSWDKTAHYLSEGIRLNASEKEVRKIIGVFQSVSV